MLIDIFGEKKEPTYVYRTVELMRVIEDDCPDVIFAQYQKDDENFYREEGAHFYANFDPILSEKYHLRTK